MPKTNLFKPIPEFKTTSLSNVNAKADKISYVKAIDRYRLFESTDIKNRNPSVACKL